jgi:L-seryl-tRNA(Ser) seleniumtransferase
LDGPHKTLMSSSFSMGPSALDLRRRLPSVERLLQLPEVRLLVDRYGRERVLAQIRVLLAEAREAGQTGDEAGLLAGVEALLPRLSERLARSAAPSLVRVINATGVVIHTNLGRAPLPPEALARIGDAASSYSNLEFDLVTGERGRRESHAGARLRTLLETEAALVVNNNAAAVLLAVNTLAEGREVLVSRGELVEIGGSFRIPDVIRKGGARLREVGTTNRTRLADYEKAISPETALILKVHPSNFAIVGFTEAPSLEALVALARERHLPLVEDLGSGLLTPLPPPLADEPATRRSLQAGVDLVTFSGDKLLGGPQAGLAVGKKSVVEALGRNPLYRALRVDKMTLAALDAVLLEHESGRAMQTLPVLRMLSLRQDDLRERTEAFALALRSGCPDLTVSVLEGTSAVGGGAAPQAVLPTLLLAVAHDRLSPDDLAKGLREGDPPVVARVSDGRLVLDLRSVFPGEDAALGQALARAAHDSPGEP